MTRQTMMAPIGGELYQEVLDGQGKRILLTYNDLWMLIVCRDSLDRDWARAHQAAGLVADPAGKQALVEYLWELEQTLGELPEIPEEVKALHGQRAHHWFQSRPVLKERQW
jgi:hypothetical protein